MHLLRSVVPFAVDVGVQATIPIKRLGDTLDGGASDGDGHDGGAHDGGPHNHTP